MYRTTTALAVAAVPMVASTGRGRPVMPIGARTAAAPSDVRLEIGHWPAARDEDR